MGKNINILIPDELHYTLRLWAATSNMTMKSLIIKLLEDAVKRQEQVERGQK